MGKFIGFKQNIIKFIIIIVVVVVVFDFSISFMRRKSIKTKKNKTKYMLQRMMVYHFLNCYVNYTERKNPIDIKRKGLGVGTI